MTYEVRIIVVGLAVFAAVGLPAALITPFVAGRWATGSAAQRAVRLANLRLLPAAAAALSSLVTCAAFLVFEPNVGPEDLGRAVPLLAVFAVVLLAAAGWRALNLVVATRSAINRWLRTATPVRLEGISVPSFAVTTDFPVVAVIGFRRPRLIIARDVLSSCTDEELQAILAHEQSHIDRRDNLRRFLISVTPDVLTWLPASARIIADWHRATEDAADDDAAKSGADGRARLASALIKVARLATGCQAQSPMPASALFGEESLDRRVRRLIDAGEAIVNVPQNPWPLRLALGLVLAGSLTVLESVHGLLEGLIHSLP